MVRGEGDRLLFALSAGVPFHAEPMRARHRLRVEPHAVSGARQRAELLVAQVPPVCRRPVRACAHHVSHAYSAGSAGAVSPDLEDRGGVLAAV